jgi:hypothetical protein
MKKTEELLREGKRLLERKTTLMLSSAPSFSVAVRRRKLTEVQARYAEVARRYEQLRNAGTEGIADLKVGLEKAWAAFEAEVGAR